MSEVEKVDKRKLLSPARLENLKNMREKLAEKKQLEKLENENKVKIASLAPAEPADQEEGEEEDVVREKPVSVPRKEKRVPSVEYSNASLEETVRSLVEKSLPPQLRREALKREKWLQRKQEIKDELTAFYENLQKPTPLQPVVKTNSTPTYSLDDLFF